MPSPSGSICRRGTQGQGRGTDGWTAACRAAGAVVQHADRSRQGYRSPLSPACCFGHRLLATHLHQAVLCDVVRQIRHHLDLRLCLRLLLCLVCLLLRSSRLLHVLLPLSATSAAAVFRPLLLCLLRLLCQLSGVLVHAGQQLRHVLPQDVVANEPQLWHLHAGRVGQQERSSNRSQAAAAVRRQAPVIQAAVVHPACVGYTCTP